jgi:hypothetical protein
MKSILSSKTIWGILIAAAPTVAQLFGYQLGENFATEAAATVDQLVQLAGLALATYGRLKANTALVVKLPKAPTD